MTETIDKLRGALADRYDVQRQIGEGGMATVYLAHDQKHHRDVAIKALRAELAATIGSERFHREVEIAARLQHPHVLPVHDSGEADGVLYYVMPYVKDESLKERLSRGPLAPGEALRIAREVASALDYAHREGVVHRDIKPANILLSEGHAVVADFGIARAASNAGDSQAMTQVGMAVGTPSYMSPEQATADPNIDGRTDIYALGCVLFEMLEGRPPFDGSTAQAIIAQTISAPVPTMDELRGKVPGAVPPAIRRALAKDPNDRFATAAEFRDALEISTGEFTGGKPGSRMRWGVAAAVVTGVLAVAIALRAPDSAVAAGADVIAVLPFDVAGAGEELGEGMVSLLATNLNAVGAIRAVDARTVLQRWRARGGEAGVDLDGSLEVGRDVNAGSIILGSIVAAGSGVRLNAEMYTVAGEELARVQLDGDADDVLALVDDLSLEILRAIWQSNEPMPSFDVAAITSQSLEAVRAYMRGSLHMRHGTWDSATASFREAVAIDSTFAMAYLALSEALGWTGNHGSAVQVEAVANAARYTDRLPPREQLLVEAYRLYRESDPVAVDSIRAYTTRYPDDPRGWYALGDIQHHGRYLLSTEEQLEPFDRALALDSSLAAAIVHPMELTLMVGDRARFERYLALNEAAGADHRGLDDVAGVLWGTADDVGAALDEIPANGTTMNVLLAAALRQNRDLLPAVFAKLDAEGQATPNAAINMGYATSMISMAIGQFDRIDKYAVAMAEEDEANIRSVGSLVKILAVTGGMKPPAYAETAVEQFRADQGDQPADYLAAILALSVGDIGTARTLLAPADSGNPSAQTRALLGWVGLLEGDTATALETMAAAFDSLPPITLGGSQMINASRLAYARALANDPTTRDEGIRHLRYGFPIQSAPEMQAASLLALAAALEAAGDAEGAALAYADFIQLWSEADDDLQPRVEDARQALARLTGERGGE